MATAAAAIAGQRQGTAPPSPLLALTEIPRALVEMGRLSFAQRALATAPRGDGHPVLVLPGFIANDVSTRFLRRYLIRQGFDAHGWELGRNLGPRSIGEEGEKLLARLDTIHDATGSSISLVGWSLGGIMARLIAARRPDMVRRIVTLGSPFAGDPRATNVWRLYQALTGHSIDGSSAQGQLSEAAMAPKVPATAIYSRGDGIVAWRSCRERSAAMSEAIEVSGSHLGLAMNPAVLYAVADRLSLAADERRPFNVGAAPRLGFPTRGR